MHATWNALLKSQRDQVTGLSIHLIAATVFAVICLLFLGLPSGWEVWLYIIPSTLLHLFYHLLLLKSYSLADMNFAYPILRGAAPLIATIFAFAFLGETPTLTAAVGILTISGGLLFLARGAPLSSVGVALATAVVIASYSVVDAAGARVNGDGIQYAVCLMMLDTVTFLPWSLRGGRWRLLLRADSATYIKGVFGGVFSVTAYAFVVYAYLQTSVGVVASLRETSIIFGALIGYYFLKEKHALRIPCAVIVAIGAILIIQGKP